MKILKILILAVVLLMGAGTIFRLTSTSTDCVDSWEGSYFLEKNGHEFLLELFPTGEGNFSFDNVPTKIKWALHAGSSNLFLHGDKSLFRRFEKIVEDHLPDSNTNHNIKSSSLSHYGLGASCLLGIWPRLYVGEDVRFYFKTLNKCS